VVLNIGYIDAKHACYQNKTAAKLVMREGEGHIIYVKKNAYIYEQSLNAKHAYIYA